MPDATGTRPNGVIKVDQLGFEATVEVIESTPRVPEGSRSGRGSLTAYLKPHCKFKFRDVNKEEF